MSIGLYDADMSVYTHVPFNLELMKLAAYYARKREIVALSPVFNPESYTRFIYRKDYYDGEFDTRLRQFDNIEYGGYAFSSNNYVSLPLEIEKQIPNAAIYSKYKDKFSTLKKYENFFGGIGRDMCTVDGCHPNDMGFALMADSIGQELLAALRYANAQKQ